ncbi:MAG: hypothetical protein JW891_09745 [Candidatus Lokiarchaeota archaeon]|nr:hypothetical protein [Candidatus Lokiarchaeota archaeon]
MSPKGEIKKRNNFLGFRLSHKDIEKLDQVAKIENKSRGLIAKQAVKNWLTLESFRKTNNMIIITKWTFFRLLSQADEELLDNIVSEMSNLLADMTRFDVSKPMDSEHFPSYSRNIIKFLGAGGLKWFNSIDFTLNNNTLVIKGLHDLDEYFSELFTRIIEHYFQTNFEFELKNQKKEISSNLVYLEFDITG